MKIIKINDGFVTNSSTDSALIIIALRKGKDLKEIMRKIGIPDNLPEEFYDFTEDSELLMDIIEDEQLEIDHLTDEYDILLNDILTFDSQYPHWRENDYEDDDQEDYNEEDFHMPYEQLRSLNIMVHRLNEKGGDDIKILEFTGSRY